MIAPQSPPWHGNCLKIMSLEMIKLSDSDYGFSEPAFPANLTNEIACLPLLRTPCSRRKSNSLETKCINEALISISAKKAAILPCGAKEPELFFSHRHCRPWLYNPIPPVKKEWTNMHEDPTLLLIDNEEQHLANIRILPALLEVIKKYRGTVLTAADISSAIVLLKATTIDLAIIAGDGQTSFFPETIRALQQFHPGVLFVAVIDDWGPAVVADDFLAVTGCHLCLSTSLGTVELVRIICREIEKMTAEKRLIADIIAARGSGKQCRMSYAHQ